MTAPPLVTIGIPTRNRRAYLVRAIETSLAQTYENIEIVVSDNASTDDTAAALSELHDPRIRIVAHAQNIGMIPNFNATLAAARGTYFLMLSDDDYLESSAVEALVAGFESAPGGIAASEVGVSWTPATILDGAGETRWVSRAGPAFESGYDFVRGSFLHGRGPRFCGTLVRTADARRVGGYQERHGFACDLGNWAQIALRHGYVACTVRALTNYTIHAASETNASYPTWKWSGENIKHDLLAILRETGRTRELRGMRVAGNALIADLLIAVVSQSVGRKNWIPDAARQAVRGVPYLVTRHFARRLLGEAWKITKLRS